MGSNGPTFFIMKGFFKDTNKPVADNAVAIAEARVFLHSAESMQEVGDGVVGLCVGASVYLGKDTPWAKYCELYDRVYNQEFRRILKEDGYFVLLQTDAFANNKVTPRNALLMPRLCRAGWVPVDTKIWKRKECDFFQPSFSQVWIFRKSGGGGRVAANKACREYLPGVWDYPQTKSANNSYPDGLCRLIIEALSKPGDLVVDAFAGSARLLSVAAAMGRPAIGYEIDKNLVSVIEGNGVATV